VRGERRVSASNRASGFDLGSAAPNGGEQIRLFAKVAAVGLFAILLSACGAAQTDIPTVEPGPAPTDTATHTRTPAPPTSTPSATVTPTATEKWPLTIVFYGDSLLKVGEVGRQGKSGYSFVDNLRQKLDPSYNLITANYGGRMAKWAFEHVGETVLAYRPDAVTLWWGFNDLLGCPGFFDRTTNAIIPERLEYLVGQHIGYLRKLIAALAEEDIPVVLLTAIPVYGGLPWSHFDSDGRLVWESGYWCDYNLGLKRLASEQRALAEEFSAAGKQVFLMDAWNVYFTNWYNDWMYSDVMHPGPKGADFLAEEWIRVFSQTGLPVRLR
jgi:lysophospholipase L1-like esterase